MQNQFFFTLKIHVLKIDFGCKIQEQLDGHKEEEKPSCLLSRLEKLLHRSVRLGLLMTLALLLDAGPGCGDLPSEEALRRVNIMAD